MATVAPLKMALALMAVILMLMPLNIGGAEAATPPSSPAPAPGPAPPPDWHNITQVLVSAGYLTQFVNLVATQTRVVEQWQTFVNASNTTGATIFAPLDVAFENTQVQTLLSNISAENLTLLLLYHSIPTFHSYKDVQLNSLDSSPTFASLQSSAPDSLFLLNVTNDDGDVTFHSSITTANVSSNYYNEFPLSIFAITQILVPSEIFGEDVDLSPPAPSPSPATSRASAAASSTPKRSMANPSQHKPGLFSALLLLLLGSFALILI